MSSWPVGGAGYFRGADEESWVRLSSLSELGERGRRRVVGWMGVVDDGEGDP